MAVKRVGAVDELAREFAREHSERLWKQLVTPDESPAAGATARREIVVVCCLAAAAALAVKVPELFGFRFGDDKFLGFYARNFSLFVLPFLAGYFVWKRGSGAGTAAWIALPFAAAVVLANAFPFAPGSDTEALTTLHLPIALWGGVGIAYAASRWRDWSGRMDFIRSILVDVCLTNAELGPEAHTVRPTVDDTVVRTIDAWKPHYLPGLESGEHTVELDLLDPDDVVVPGPFKTTERVIQSMTFLPRQVSRVPDRGMLRPGGTDADPDGVNPSGP